MLRTKVILLNVTNLSDARYAAGMGVEFIGFSINPVSNHYVTATDVNTITDWLSGVSLVGDLGGSMADYSDYKVDYLLTSNLEMVKELEEPVLSLPITHDNTESVREVMQQHASEVSFFILRVAKDDFQTLENSISMLNAEFNCYLSMDFDEHNLKRVLTTKPKGIVLYGSHEEKPGLSNYDGIADILEMLDEM